MLNYILVVLFHRNTMVGNISYREVVTALNKHNCASLVFFFGGGGGLGGGVFLLFLNFNFSLLFPDKNIPLLAFVLFNLLVSCKLQWHI